MRKLFYGTAVFLLLATTVFADSIISTNTRPVNIGASSEATLQSLLNNIYGPVKVNVTSDQQKTGLWQLPTAGSDVLAPLLRFEFAGNAPSNVFGIWTGHDTNVTPTMAPIFQGSDVNDAVATLQWIGGSPNTVKIRNSSGIQTTYSGINRYSFGFYLEGPGGTFYTADQLNGGDAHALAFVNPVTDKWTLAWEDLTYAGGADKDFNDMVVSVESITPVPDGGLTLMLLGGVLVGLETLRRKFRA